ncbi:coagulase domain-containing protein [Staphylococcus agnetis]|uniref:coagulase domain-containing protein n=1 Tax=Staphylococcus agnetis TaxID=985762 RepID=UPI000D19EFD1|nr:coagulase domain-containing protein [Staphylococcus agnetis]PTH56780.1 hypothetical protein BU584_09700 [Staphylococcus agnetis]
MKKKLLVLSASALLASNFVFDNSASAVVRGTDYKSEALEIEGKRNPDITLQKYKDSFKDLILKQSINAYGGYDEPEYKEAYLKYQGKFLAELEALNKFAYEDENEKGKKPGMTQERYKLVYEALQKNKKEFIEEVEKIEQENPHLTRYFDRDKEFSEGINKVYDLEDQALMAMSSFIGRPYKDARDQLYYKLSLIVGSTDQERVDKLPTNRKMMDDMRENLETIIDEFFKDVKLERPKTIAPLTVENQDDINAFKKVREDALKAKNDEKFRDPGVKERAEKLEKANKKAKEEREAKAKELKEKGLLRGKAFTPKNFPLYFSHKNLKDQNESENVLIIREIENQPTQFPMYTESASTTPVLKQEKREEIIDSNIFPRFNQNNTLKGMEGESAPVTVVSEPAIKATSAPQQKVVEGHTGFSGSNNNLSGMGGESKEVSFTYDSQPVDFDIITESNEIVLDQHTDIKVSGFTTGESIEDSHVSNEVTK